MEDLKAGGVELSMRQMGQVMKPVTAKTVSDTVRAWLAV
jgi:hypothetical protein